MYLVISKTFLAFLKFFTLFVNMYVCKVFGEKRNPTSLTNTYITEKKCQKDDDIKIVVPKKVLGKI